MIEALRKIWARINIDPERSSLAWWLAVTNVLVVALIVGGISLYAIGLLRDQANAQGQARVQLAGAMAREDLRRAGEDAVVAARSVAGRRTLARLLSEGRPEALQPILQRFCLGPTIDACAVFNGPSVVVQVGTALPWNDIAASSLEQGERFMAAPQRDQPAVIGAVAPLDGYEGARLFVARQLDEELARQLSERVGLTVRLINYRAFAAADVDAFTALHSAGLADGSSALARIDALDLYAASFPLFASTGEAIALIETRLPSKELDSAVARLVKRLLYTALFLALLGVGAGFFFAQQVTGPLRALTQAADRLGRGDFSTSIPVGGAAEVGALARTMEDMRRNLVDLTNTLRRRENEAQAVLGGIVEGVYAVDRNREIRYLNPQAARLLGVDAAQALGRFCGDVLKPCIENGRRPCEYRCPIVQAQSQGVAGAVERLVTDGLPRTTVITSAAPVDGLQVQVIRDETELEAVRRARDSVLANISHEFRTPLAAQLASIELLREGLDTMPAGNRRELVLALQRGTLRLMRLIDNLLESVRIESGQLAIRHQSVALAEIIEDAHALVGPLLIQREQKLDVSLPDELPPLNGDGPRLTQVFVNLLANASKFGPEGSTVRIGAARGEREVTAWVEDSGPGVPGMDDASLFDRFQRGPGEEPEPGGLGLGLWIVRSIVDRHGGKVGAERTADNRTRFSVTLPLEGEA